jgi:phenylacetate-CoA ligase
VLKDKPPKVQPPLVLKVESAQTLGADGRTALKGRIEHRIFEILRVRAAIDIVEPMSLPRASGKSKLIEIQS